MEVHSKYRQNMWVVSNDFPSIYWAKYTITITISRKMVWGAFARTTKRHHSFEVRIQKCEEVEKCLLYILIPTIFKFSLVNFDNLTQHKTNTQNCIHSMQIVIQQEKQKQNISSLTRLARALNPWPKSPHNHGMCVNTTATRTDNCTNSLQHSQSC